MQAHRSWGKYPEKQKPFIFEPVPIRTIARIVRTDWMPELAQDLEAYHHIDAETEYLEDKNENKLTRKVLFEKYNPNTFWLNIETTEFIQYSKYLQAKMFNSLGIPAKYLSQ